MNRDLTVAVAAGLAYILAIVAVGLFIYHLTLLGIAFALATISAIFCGLYVQFWEQAFGNKPKRSVPLMAALLSAAVIIIFDAIQAKHPPDWRTFPNTVLVFNVGDRAHSYSKLIAVDRDHFLLPITALTFIHILNERDVPMRIVGYNLEYASEPPGPWIRLCRIDLEPGHLVYLAFNDRTKAIPIRLDRRIDQILRHGPVPPRDTISGWSAWYCPAMAVNCEQKYFRLSIRDELGTTNIQMIENIKTDITPDLLPSAKFVSRGPRDLSNVPARWPETCPIDPNLS